MPLIEKIRAARVVDVILLISAFLLVAQFILPAPAKPAYLVQRLLYKPLYECSDGRYAFELKNACAGSYKVKAFKENIEAERERIKALRER